MWSADWSIERSTRWIPDFSPTVESKCYQSLGIGCAHIPTSHQRVLSRLSEAQFAVCAVFDVVLNINSVVEILVRIVSGETWESSLREAIPSRKIRSAAELRDEFNYRNIRTERQLYEIPTNKLPQFDFRNILTRCCVKMGKKLEWLNEEHDVKKTKQHRFTTRVVIDGEVAGVGEGNSIKIAASYAAWKGLEWIGVYQEEESETVKEWSFFPIC